VFIIGLAGRTKELEIPPEHLVSTANWDGPRLTIVTRQERGGEVVESTQVWTIEGRPAQTTATWPSEHLEVAAGSIGCHRRRGTIRVRPAHDKSMCSSRTPVPR